MGQKMYGFPNDGYTHINTHYLFAFDLHFAAHNYLILIGNQRSIN